VTQRGNVWLSPLARTGFAGRRADLIISALLLALWLAVVIFTTTRHEYWRDEVRAWSLARAARSPVDLFHLIRYEGHPALWYLLLYLGHAIADSPLVLPITSLGIAGAAMTLFMLRSPFPLWLRALFLFSGLPLYEYSVLARNYGISMLLMFLVASLYRYRTQHPLALATTLALLANTNIHSTILALLLMVVWLWDEWRPRGSAPDRMPAGPLFLAAAIVGLGILLSIVLVSPPRDTVLTHFYSKSPESLASAFGAALFYPRTGFRSLFPSSLPWAVGQAMLYLAILGLLRRPILALAALGGLVALGVLFRVGSPGAYRHAGLFMCFLLCLYWIAAAESSEAGPKRRSGLRLVEFLGYGCLTALILASVYRSRIVPIDITHQMSSSKALGAFLNSQPSFRDAILVPEPDYYIESLPYYAHNLIYFARERRFGNTVTWSSRAAARLSLGQLVSQAQQLKARYQRPVLVVLGHPGILTEKSGEARLFYNKRFTWSAREYEDAERSWEKVAEFWTAYSDENYSVYAVK
jgi:hypothetical protein